MIAHVVLYELKPELTQAERDHFAHAVADAFAKIPSIRKARVGHRVRGGHAYEAQMPGGYDFIGVLEFDDERGLREYLDHPAHEPIGQLFWSCSARSIVFDYELAERDLASFLQRFG